MNDNNMMQFMYDYLSSLFIVNNTSLNDKTVLQFLPLGIAINLKDFSNPISAVNFDQGSLASSKNFAQLVNDIPYAQPQFISQGKLEDVYSWILDNAVATKEWDIDEEAKKRYDYAYKLLYTTIEQNGQSVDVPSIKYEEYNKALDAYEDAIFTRNMTFLEIDHTSPKGSKYWNCEKRKLDGEIKKAYNTLSKYRDIDNALDILKTTYAYGIKELVAREKENFSSSAQTSDVGKNWYLCSAFPSNWYENDNMYKTVTIDGNSEKNISSSQYLTFSGESSLNAGIFSGSASAEHKQKEIYTDNETNVTGIKMDIAAVRIERLWLNETLFALDGWKISGYPKGHISDGTFITTNGNEIKHNEGIMPLIPKYMLVAKNITLTGVFSKELKEKISQETDAETSIGIGPFKIKGSVENHSGDENIQTECGESSITVKTPQIIGYISSVVKFSPKNE